MRVLLPALLALLVAAAALSGGTAALDRAGLFALAGGPAPLWGAISTLGDTLVRSVVAGVIVAVLLARRRVAAALRLAVAVAGGMALNDLWKALAHRARPDLLPHLDPVGSWSLPSGHAAGAMTLGLALALLARRQRPAIAAALVYALAVGVSRVALAVHWPSDVLVGWLWGAAWTLAVMRAGTSPRGRDTRAGSRP